MAYALACVLLMGTSNTSTPWGSRRVLELRYHWTGSSPPLAFTRITSTPNPISPAAHPDATMMYVLLPASKEPTPRGPPRRKPGGDVFARFTSERPPVLFTPITCTPCSGYEVEMMYVLPPTVRTSTECASSRFRETVSPIQPATDSEPLSCTRSSCTPSPPPDATAAYVRPPISKAATPRAPEAPPMSAASASTGTSAPYISMSAEAASEPFRPGTGRVRFAALPAGSRIAAPPGSARACFPAYPRRGAESPGCTAYRNSRVPVPLPPAYEALRGGSVASASDGAPSTTTGSSSVMKMATMRPVPCVPFGLGESTRSTDGADPSMTMSRLCPSEPGLPGAGSVRRATAATPCVPWRIAAPPGRDRAATPA